MMGQMHVGRYMMITDQEALEEFGAFVQRGENAVGALFALFLTSKDHLKMPKNDIPSTKARRGCPSGLPWPFSLTSSATELTL